MLAVWFNCRWWVGKHVLNFILWLFFLHEPVLAIYVAGFCLFFFLYFLYFAYIFIFIGKKFRLPL
jgi:hypothetical protein